MSDDKGEIIIAEDAAGVIHIYYHDIPKGIGHKLSKSGSRQIQGKLRQRFP